MQPFVILFAERSGSTLLQTMLAGHPQIRCYGEVFCEDVVPDAEGKPNCVGRIDRFADPAQSTRYLEELWFSGSQGSQVSAVGFKYKYPYQVQLYTEVWRYLLDLNEQNGLKVLHLYRLNLLKAAVSKQNQQLLWRERQVANLTASDEYRIAKLELDVPAACRYMAIRKAYLEEFQQRVAVFSSRFDVSYEELLESTEETLKQVLAFLDVDSCFSPAPGTKKLTADRLEEALSNYGQVVEQLSETEFEEYLA